MGLVEQIDNDIKCAMRESKTDELSLLRLVKSALKNAQIAKGDELGELEVISVLEKQAKQRRDSILQYRAGRREDLAMKEEFELDLISNYLPQKMSEDELLELVVSTIAELGATNLSDMGKVIKEVMTKANGSADGGTVSRLVKERLG